MRVRRVEGGGAVRGEGAVSTPPRNGWKSSIADWRVALVNKRLFAVSHAQMSSARFVYL